MAAITSAVIAVGATGYSVYNSEKQRSDAKKQTLKTQREIDDFQRQDLVNPFKNIQISTLKSDQQTDAAQSNFATSVDALQRAGTRGVLGGIPSINESNILLQNIISTDLDEKAKARDLAIAQAEMRNQDIREGRESSALLGLGQQLQTARQDEASAKAGLVSGVLALGQAGVGLASAIKSKTNGEDFNAGGEDFNAVADVTGYEQEGNTVRTLGNGGKVLSSQEISYGNTAPFAQVQPLYNPNSPFFYESQVGNAQNIYPLIYPQRTN